MTDYCVNPKECYLCQGGWARVGFEELIKERLEDEKYLSKRSREEFMSTFGGSLGLMADWLGQEVEEEVRRTGDGLLCEEHLAKVQWSFRE